MKKLICLVMMLIVSSIASAVMKEDFQSYNAGVLSTQGWVFTSGDGEVITGSNDTKVLQPYNGGYVQGTHGAPNNYTYATDISVSSPGKAYFAAQMRPQMVGDYGATQTEIGCVQGNNDSNFLFTIGVTTAANPNLYDHRGRFCFSSSNRTLHTSENVEMFDAAGQGYIFDIAVNLNIVNSSTIYASLSYRNVSLGGDWVQTSLTNETFDNTNGIQNNARTYVYGYVGGEIDNLRMGMGQIGATDIKEDFQSYNLGALSTQGWSLSSANGEVIIGANGTKVAQPCNNGYVQGMHGAPGNSTYSTSINVSSAGKAYFAAQMRPQMVGDYGAVQTEIGCVHGSNDNFLFTIGVNTAANPNLYDHRGRFCFSSSDRVLHNSENVVMFDASGQGYIFDIAVNLNIINSSTIYASLSYRNVSLGGDWVQTSLTNETFDNTNGIQNSARTYIYGYVHGEMDNLRMGMGQIGASAVKENFESYTLNSPLPTQAPAPYWTLSSANDQVITGVNGTKVVQPYGGNGYVQGTCNTTYATGIDYSNSGSGYAYFAAQIRPGMVGSYGATQTEIGCFRYDGNRLCTIGVTTAENPELYDHRGRFCFSSSSSTLQTSENVVMFDTVGQGYIFDIAVNLDIVNYSEVYATLLYRNVSLGGDWVQSSVLTNVLFDNTYDIQNTAKTYLYGYVHGEIDNFQMGMGHIQGVAPAYSPFPANGTSGVDPGAILTWQKGCPATAMDVYFGTSSSAVANATTASAEYMGKYNPDTGFDVLNYNASGLTPGVTYYWRVAAGDSKLVSRVWSFKVNGGIVTTDTQQAEINSSLTPVYTPITHGAAQSTPPYFANEPELFGYAPRFSPGVTSFDASNRPYIITGGYDTGGNIISGTVIQTLDSTGRWIGLDPYQSIKAAYPLWNGVWCPWDRNIVFDNDDDAYMIVKINVTDNGTDNRTLLLYSRDKCWTWTCYELPGSWTLGARLESRKGFNEITGPPAIIGEPGDDGGAIQIVVPTKSNGVLTIPSPTTIYNSTTAWLAPNHSGFGNVAVTKGNYTHVVWMTMDNLSGHTGQAPVYAATYTRSTKAVSSPVLIGYAATQDNHNGPVVTMDSTGYLHVIIGGHTQFLQYAKSPNSNSTAGSWTPAYFGSTSTGTGYSYTAFLCDASDTLHLMSRWSGTDSNYKFYLVYLYKTSAGSWQSNTTIVDPNRMFYMCWYNELTMDRENRLFLRYSSLMSQLDRNYLNGPYTEFNAYRAKWPSESLAWLSPAPPDPGTQNFCTSRAHDPVVLIKDNQGQAGSGWRLADTADFFNRMFKDGFEKGEFTTAGWTKLNSNATVATAAKYTGTYGAKLAGNTTIERRISTKGITGIHVKYNIKTYGMSGSEYLYVQWSVDGTNWYNLYSGRPTSWLLNQDNTCAAGAENNANFRIRFYTTASTTSRYAYVDDVEVTGTRF